ncbi:MAG TPA: M24 family metallopeptidase [Acidimicrobiia bacterium]|nr:M24 family metallopeptidase [Acidimicrobiia bacterium]
MTTDEHLRRCLDEMARERVDVLVLGREANARYVSGATRLWLAGTRPFGPGCVVVRSTGAVHLLSTTDDLVPLPRERLFPMSWNPGNIVRALSAIAGVRGARRVAVDALTPGFDGLLRDALPGAELADGSELIARVRRTKTDDDVAAIRGAIAVAERALSCVLDGLRPGVRERDLVGAFAEASSAQGVTTPAFEPVFCVVDDGGPARTFPTARAIADGDLVDATVGVLSHGWEGRLARTWVCGAPSQTQRAAWGAFLEHRVPALLHIAPGKTVGDVRCHPGIEVRGVGTGDELLGDDVPLAPGTVLALSARHDGMHVEDTWLVRDDGSERLTLFPCGPLDEAAS